MNKRKTDAEPEIDLETSCYDEDLLISRENEENTFEEEELLSKVSNRTYLIIAIYDIINDRRRLKIAKILLGYGERVQRSAFECHLTNRQYEAMIRKLLPLLDEEEDLLRIYKLTGNAKIKVWGHVKETEDEDVVII